jgi:hypothetical protein
MDERHERWPSRDRLFGSGGLVLKSVTQRWGHLWIPIGYTVAAANVTMLAWLMWLFIGFHHVLPIDHKTRRFAVDAVTFLAASGLLLVTGIAFIMAVAAWYAFTGEQRKFLVVTLAGMAVLAVQGYVMVWG